MQASRLENSMPGILVGRKPLTAPVCDVVLAPQFQLVSHEVEIIALA